jgi:DNA mismatch repair protein MutS2
VPSQLDSREESLSLLEWPAVSARVARFASTDVGKRALLGVHGMIEVPEDRERSELLLGLTRDAYRLEYTLAKPLTFLGVHDIAHDVRMTAKGLALDGKQLLRVADTLGAARKIRRHIEAAAQPTRGEDEERASTGSSDVGVAPELHRRAVADCEMLNEMGEAGGAWMPRFVKLVSHFRTWPDVEAEIRETVDEFGSVFDSCDAQLAGLRRGIKDVTASIRERLQSLMAAHPDAIQDRVITTRYNRFVIPVKVGRKGEFRKGVVHDISQTGSTVFIEPQATRALNDKLRELIAREKARVAAVLRKVSLESVAQTADDVDHLSAVLAMIDAATARARASHSLDGVDVVFDNSSPICLRRARHPLLSWKAMDEEQAAALRLGSGDKVNDALEGDDGGVKGTSSHWKKQVVPSDYIVGDDVRCVCVTGPNTCVGICNPDVCRLGLLS